MNRMITSSAHCLCDAHLTVATPDWNTIQAIQAAFEDDHTGDGHHLYPTEQQARDARRPRLHAGEPWTPTRDRDLNHYVIPESKTGEWTAYLDQVDAAKHGGEWPTPPAWSVMVDQIDAEWVAARLAITGCKASSP